METVVLACANPSDTGVIRETLAPEFEVIHCATYDALMAFLSRSPDESDLIVVDSSIAPSEFTDCIGAIRKRCPMVVLIALMDRGQPDAMVASVKAGCTDIITKPYFQSVVLVTVRHALEQSHLVGHLHRQLARVESESIRRRLTTFCDFLTQRRREGFGVTPRELQLFFPGAKASEIPLDQVLEMMNSTSLSNLVAPVNYRPRAIVVEDEPAVRTLVTRVLSKEFQVAAYPNVEAAVAALAVFREQSDPVDLAVLDIGLPGRSGDDWVAQLKSENPGISIIVVTGFAEHRLIVKTLQSGADDYIVKPFNNRDLLAKATVHVQARLTQRWVDRFLGR